MLKDNFTQLLGKYAADASLQETYWQEIVNAYSEPKRHYHNLSHLENLLALLVEVQHKINDWDSLLFALYYHDFIYKSTASDNEEQSADVAKARLTAIGYPGEQPSKCVAIIMATKNHVETGDKDTDYFTDADLSILGQSWEQYMAYSKQVRREYSFYPDILYKRGRKKVINHFLEMKRIFKTQHFFDKFEKFARQNLARELNIL